ncbi:VanZ family protein [Desulfofundulus sp.]|uniref:VanZ family protein n=1 Tax=Desulfofundulus sp. TaxID=2282750 RepID=UPI003C75B288
MCGGGAGSAAGKLFLPWPAREQPPSSSGFHPVLLRKGAHVVIYGALGLSLAAALQGLNKRRWFVAGMILVLVASLDEWR